MRSGKLIWTKAPDAEIVGTCERVCAMSPIEPTVTISDDGALIYEHSGAESPTYWDTMETDTLAGKGVIFQTAAGDEAPESECAVLLADGTLVPVVVEPAPDEESGERVTEPELAVLRALWRREVGVLNQARAAIERERVAAWAKCDLSMVERVEALLFPGGMA